jgi:hypothetical protein
MTRHIERMRALKLPMPRIITASALAVALAFPASASAWPTWGNEEKGDCTFAAVANWELVQTQWLFPRQPTEAEVIQDYEEANPNDQGFSVEELFEFWRENYIGGVEASTYSGYPPYDLWWVIHHYGPEIVLFQHHMGVVRYIGHRGPVVLSWGRLINMTWAQWEGRRRSRLGRGLEVIVPEGLLVEP